MTSDVHEDSGVDEVTQADREADEAHAEVEQLEERVRDGDDQVTPDQVEKARGLARFTQMRREAARRRAERKQQADREAEAQRLVGELRSDEAGSLRASQQAIGDALSDAQAAVQRLVELSDQHNRLVGDYAGRLRKLDDVLPDGAQASSGAGAPSLRVGSWSARSVTPLGAVAAAIQPVLGRLNVNSRNGKLVQTMYMDSHAEGFRP